MSKIIIDDIESSSDDSYNEDSDEKTSDDSDEEYSDEKILAEKTRCMNFFQKKEEKYKKNFPIGFFQLFELGNFPPEI